MPRFRFAAGPAVGAHCLEFVFFGVLSCGTTQKRIAENRLVVCFRQFIGDSLLSSEVLHMVLPRT